MYLSSMCIDKSNKLHNPANLKILIQITRPSHYQPLTETNKKSAKSAESASIRDSNKKNI